MNKIFWSVILRRKFFQEIGVSVVVHLHVENILQRFGNYFQDFLNFFLGGQIEDEWMSVKEKIFESMMNTSKGERSRRFKLACDRFHCIPLRIVGVREERNASEESAIFRFHIHTPFTRLETVFHRIQTIAVFTPTGDSYWNTVRCRKGCGLSWWSPLPMMIDGSL